MAIDPATDVKSSASTTYGFYVKFQPVGFIINGNLFIKASCCELQWGILDSSASSRSKNFNSRLPWFG